MKDLQQLRDIAAQLRELQRTSPASTADVPAWEAAARKFSDGLSVPVPAQVMHYWHDADRRAKDTEDRAAQDEILSGIITDLGHGRVPESAGANLSFHPRWLGVFALVALVVIYWVVVR